MTLNRAQRSIPSCRWRLAQPAARPGAHVKVEGECELRLTRAVTAFFVDAIQIRVLIWSSSAGPGFNESTRCLIRVNRLGYVVYYRSGPRTNLKLLIQVRRH